MTRILNNDSNFVVDSMTRKNRYDSKIDSWLEICIMTRILNNDSNFVVGLYDSKNRYDSKIDSWLEICIMTRILNYDSKNRYDSKFVIVTRNSGQTELWMKLE